MHERAVAALVRAAGEPEGDGGTITLASPSPGLFRIAVRAGDLVRPGSVLGELEVLGRSVVVTAPDGVRGAVIAACGDGLARPAVDHGAALVTVDPRALSGDADALSTPAGATGPAPGRVFRAPTGGRFYGGPSPGKPPFVTAGDELVQGATICLLEVMKTFQRVTYAGEPARVREVLVPEGADVDPGDPLLALE